VRRSTEVNEFVVCVANKEEFTKNKPVSRALSARRTGFYLSPVDVGFLLDTILRFSPVSVNPPMIYKHQLIDQRHHTVMAIHSVVK
jgi:hypothetical protein